MKTRTVTVELTFKVFDKGDRVKPSSSRSTLDQGIWTVSKFIDPSVPHELDGTVFVEGKKFGYSAEYIMLADEPEFEH